MVRERRVHQPGAARADHSPSGGGSIGGFTARAVVSADSPRGEPVDVDGAISQVRQPREVQQVRDTDRMAADPGRIEHGVDRCVPERCDCGLLADHIGRSVAVVPGEPERAIPGIRDATGNTFEVAAEMEHTGR